MGFDVQGLIDAVNRENALRAGTKPLPSIPEVKTEELDDEEVAILSDTDIDTDDADGGAAPSDGKGLMSPSESLRPRARPTELEDPTQALLDRIALGEGADPSKLSRQEKHGIGTTVYDMVYNYGDTLAPSKPVSEMTMEELYNFQTKLINATKGTVPGTNLGTSAVGKYQVIRKSLFGTGTAEKPMKNSWADKLNLKPDTVYTPEVQEKIARLALQEAGYNSFIKGTKTEEAFHDRIANIWASVARSSGKDTYGQGIHTIKADLDPMYALLKE
jgi:muramidase (phage lysozyme)